MELEDTLDDVFDKLDLPLDIAALRLANAESISVSSTSVKSLDFDTLRLNLLASPVGMANFVKPLGTDGTPVPPLETTLDDFRERDLAFEKSGGAIDVSPMIDPDFNPESLVTRVPSSTKLLDFLDNEAGFDNDLEGLAVLVGTSAASSSSRVKVEALRRDG